MPGGCWSFLIPDVHPHAGSQKPGRHPVQSKGSFSKPWFSGFRLKSAPKLIATPCSDQEKRDGTTKIGLARKTLPSPFHGEIESV